jgi:hypothetical protein
VTGRKIPYGVISPEADAEFVAGMVEALDVYESPHERSASTTSTSGTATIFMFAAPKSGWREATARPTKTNVDWAAEVARLRFRHTPKHGRWLHVAETERSAMTRPCLRGRRLGTPEELRDEIAARSADVNRTQRGDDWQMKLDDARCKLKSVYPKIRR